MKYVERLLAVIAIMILSACASATRFEPVASPPPQNIPSVVTGTIEGNEEAAIDEEVAVAPVTNLEVKDIEVAPECAWPDGQDPKKFYIRHNACPQHPGRGPLKGQVPYKALVDVQAYSGYDCRNATDPSKKKDLWSAQNGLAGKSRELWIPRGAVVWFYPNADGTADLSMTGSQCGCWNDTEVVYKVNSAGKFQRIGDTKVVPARNEISPKPRRKDISLSVVTGQPQNITDSSAYLTGSANLVGSSAPALCWFRVQHPNGEVHESPATRQNLDRLGTTFGQLASGNLKQNQIYRYQTVCRMEKGLTAAGEWVSFKTQSLSWCRSHPRLCPALKYTAGTIFTAAVGYGIYRAFNHPDHKQPNNNPPPCSGYCTDQPVNPGPPWDGGGNPGGGTQPNPPPPWPGDNGGGTQPGPPPPWPGDTGSNTGGGTTTTPPPPWDGGGGNFGGGGASGGSGGTTPPPSGGTNPPPPSTGGTNPPPWDGGGGGGTTPPPPPPPSGPPPPWGG